MNHIRLTASLCLTALLLMACFVVPIITPAHLETPTPNLTTSPEVTETGFPPTETDTPEPTDSPEPTDTATPTDTHTPAPPTLTPTPAPPLGKITDTCLLLATKDIETGLNYKIAHVQKAPQPKDYSRCFWFNADGSAGVTLGTAQGDTALALVATDIVQFGAAPNCSYSQLPNADPKAVQQQLDKLAQVKNQKLKAALDTRFQTIKDKSCADKLGIQSVPGIGDVAYVDSIYGSTELEVGDQDTLIVITVYAKGLTAPDALKAETTFMDAIITYLITHP